MMQEKKNQKEYSTCLEDGTFAQAIQKAMNQQSGDSCFNHLSADTDKLTAGRSTRSRREIMVESLMKLHACADCPIRCRAAAKPQSLFARIHRWHKTWWPGWKMYQAELRISARKTAASHKLFTVEEL
jgi:hypothetical protein